MCSNVVKIIVGLALLATLQICSPATYGQGVLVIETQDGRSPDNWRLPRVRRPNPRPDEATYRIKELSIDAKIKDQIATTNLTQTFVNTGNQTMEVSFVFPLPYDGAIESLTFLVDGKELQAKLLPATKAREIYNGYVRRFQDPALLEWVGTGMFKSSIFPVPAGASRTVTLKYSQLLKKDSDITDYTFPLSTAKYTSQPIDEVNFRLAINSSIPLKNVYSPTHAVSIKRDDDVNAVVAYNKKKTIPSSDFRILIGTAAGKIGASVVSYWPADEEEGYFVMFASPEIKKTDKPHGRKSILFVVDRSGSMNGKKITQAREAAKFVLNNLNDGDLFNIVAYDAVINSYEEELQSFSSQTQSSALGFINGIHAGGSTNISEALKVALEKIQDDSIPNYVVFLTDGRPTAGEKNEMKIVEGVKQLNKYGARLINFGVGFDVNSRLLDRLTTATNGQGEYVRPNEDIESAVSRLYSKIASPLFTNVVTSFAFDSANDKPAINRMYPSKPVDIFQGGQLVIVGRYTQSGAAKIRLAGKMDGKDETVELTGEFVAKGKTNNNEFVANLWAKRRIGEIIDQIDLNGHNSELVEELVRLSMKHGIMTRYTSFLADENSVSKLTDTRANSSLTLERLSQLEMQAGQNAFSQRADKQSLKNSLIGGRGGGLVAEGAQAIGMGGTGLSGGSIGGGSGFGGGGAGGGGQGGVIASNGIQQTTNNTAYKRGNVVYAANATDIDLEKDKDKILTIKRYSKEYFDLTSLNTKTENELLANQSEKDELVIRLRGQVYRIN